MFEVGKPLTGCFSLHQALLPLWRPKLSVKRQRGFPISSWYQRTLFFVYAGANWEATTSGYDKCMY